MWSLDTRILLWESFWFFDVVSYQIRNVLLCRSPWRIVDEIFQYGKTYGKMTSRKINILSGCLAINADWMHGPGFQYVYIGSWGIRIRHDDHSRWLAPHITGGVDVPRTCLLKSVPERHWTMGKFLYDDTSMHVIELCASLGYGYVVDYVVACHKL